MQSRGADHRDLHEWAYLGRQGFHACWQVTIPLWLIHLKLLKQPDQQGASDGPSQVAHWKCSSFVDGHTPSAMRFVDGQKLS